MMMHGLTNFKVRDLCASQETSWKEVFRIYYIKYKFRYGLKLKLTEKNPVPIEQEACCASGPVWAARLRI
jgi:hypothetical protein